jgi:hypothetical protein
VGGGAPAPTLDPPLPEGPQNPRVNTYERERRSVSMTSSNSSMPSSMITPVHS